MNKYRNKKIAGYASKKEAKRAQELKLMEKAGGIHNLQEQVKFVLIPKQEGERECSYFADYTYYTGNIGDFDSNKYVVEDVKSAITKKNPAYIMKRKLMLWVHGIRITEI